MRIVSRQRDVDDPRHGLTKQMEFSPPPKRRSPTPPSERKDTPDPMPKRKRRGPKITDINKILEGLWEQAQADDG